MQDVQAGDICLNNGTDAYDAYKADLASIQAGTGKVNSSYLFGGGNLVGYGEDLEELNKITNGARKFAPFFVLFCNMKRF